METILVSMKDIKRVIDLLGGAIKITGDNQLGIETDRHDRRSLHRAGIHYVYPDSPKARGA